MCVCHVFMSRFLGNSLVGEWRLGGVHGGFKVGLGLGGVDQTAWNAFTWHMQIYVYIYIYIIAKDIFCVSACYAKRCLF